MIKTLEELEALPVGSVLKTADGSVIRLHERKPGRTWWRATGSGFWEDKTAIALPATLLIPTTVSQEQVSDLRGVLYDAGVTGKVLDTAVVKVLSTLGLEVGDE